MAKKKAVVVDDGNIVVLSVWYSKRAIKNELKINFLYFELIAAHIRP